MGSHRHRHRREWSELPVELLELILSRPTMEPIDLLRCRDVCRSWRSTVANRYQSQLHPALLPAVLYIPGKTKIARGTHVPYTFLTNTAQVYRLNLPYQSVSADSNERRYTYNVTSSRGWLLLEDRTKSISYFFLFNPVSRIKLELPRSVQKLHMSKSAMSTSPRDPRCIILVQSRMDQQFRYCRVGDARWTLIVGDQGMYDDITYYGGRFYAVNKYNDQMTCFEFADDRNRPPIVSQIQPRAEKLREKPKQRGLCLSKYLVELPPCCHCSVDGSNRPDLVLVTRGTRWQQFNWEFGAKSSCESCDTAWFRVFKMDWIKNTWREVTNFDCNNCNANERKLALFLAHDDSFFLCARDPKQCKSNCIYFVDDMDRANPRRVLDMGLFDLENERIEPFYNSPFTRWFIPDLSL